MLSIKCLFINKVDKVYKKTLTTCESKNVQQILCTVDAYCTDQTACIAYCADFIKHWGTVITYTSVHREVQIGVPTGSHMDFHTVFHVCDQSCIWE